jgi:hypothetical protein
MKNVLKKIAIKRNITTKLFLSLLISVLPISYESGKCVKIYTESEITNVELDNCEFKIKPLIEAMILVESEGNDSAYCKKEEAVGCLQIRPIMLAECNRILKLQKSSISYNLLDRWSRKKSIEIFHIINQYHNKDATYEEIARFWNGGPNWAEKSGTKRYWWKVRRKLKKLSEENEEYSSDWLAQI